MFEVKVLPRLKESGFASRKVSKGVYYLTRENNGVIEQYKYNSSNDILKDIRTGEKWIWGIFKVLTLAKMIDVDLFPTPPEVTTREEEFENVITPYLRKKGIYTNNYLLGKIIFNEYFAFVYYPSTGKAVSTITIELGILELF
jgi:hypothetical protein